MKYKILGSIWGGSYCATISIHRTFRHAKKHYRRLIDVPNWKIKIVRISDYEFNRHNKIITPLR